MRRLVCVITRGLILTLKIFAYTTLFRSKTVTIGQVPNAPTAPVTSVVDPTCTTPTGTVTITTPVTGLEFKIASGSSGAYPTGGWSGLTPGDHTITVRSAADPACTTPKTVTIGQVPNAPTAPVTSVVDPTCTTPTGTVTITSPVTGLEFKVDNGTYSPYTSGRITNR